MKTAGGKARKALLAAGSNTLCTVRHRLSAWAPIVVSLSRQSGTARRGTRRTAVCQGTLRQAEVMRRTPLPLSQNTLFTCGILRYGNRAAHARPGIQHEQIRGNDERRARHEYTETVPRGTDRHPRVPRAAPGARAQQPGVAPHAHRCARHVSGRRVLGLFRNGGSALFDVYHVDTMWLMSVRQLLAGATVHDCDPAVRPQTLRAAVDHVRASPHAADLHVLRSAGQPVLLPQRRAPHQRRNRDRTAVPAAGDHHGVHVHHRAPPSAQARARRPDHGARRHGAHLHRRRPVAPVHPAAGPCHGPAHRAGSGAHHHLAGEDPSRCTARPSSLGRLCSSRAS